MAPAPPPPPGPPPPLCPPPPPTFATSKASSGDGRNQLLQSIRQGAKLKKTVTVDKSAPLIQGKAISAGGGSGTGDGVKGNAAVSNGSGSLAAPVGLGGLFAGGMPKLRSTGKSLAGSQNEGPKPTHNSSSAPIRPPNFQTSPENLKTRTPAFSNSAPVQNPASNVSQLSAALSEALGSRIAENIPKKQVVETRVRGPPPQPPAQRNNMPLSSSDSVLTTARSLSERINSLHMPNSGPTSSSTDKAAKPSNLPGLQKNKSCLHGAGPQSIGGSMSSLSGTSSLPSPAPSSSLSTSDLSTPSEHNPVSRVLSHGKPNLAPKPPNFGEGGKPSPSPKKLMLNGKTAARTQSMRVPRTPPVSPPSPQPPAPPPARSALGAQLGPTPPITTKMPNTHFGTMRVSRAPLRPPAAGPPPPPARLASLAPTSPPPPPPHQHRNINTMTSNGEDRDASGAVNPLPPVRGSSMRGVIQDLEARFADVFRPPSSFPVPEPYRRIEKGYSSYTASTVIGKQQAPLPPTTHIQLGSKLWSCGDTSAC